MEKKSKNDLIIFENIFYKYVEKNIPQIKSPYKNALTSEDLDKYIESFDNNRIENLKSQLESKDTNSMSREEIFDFLDSIDLQYSPEELDNLGLSKSFKGSLIYSFLKYDFQQKYESNTISDKVYISTEGCDKNEITFKIDRGLYELDKIGQENFFFFISMLLAKLETILEIYIQHEEFSNQSYHVAKKYMKIIRKLLTQLKGDNKEKIQSLSHTRNNIIGRKYHKLEQIEELKKILHEHIQKLKENKRQVFEFLESFKEMEKELETNKIDKNKIRNFFKKMRFNLYVKSPEGTELGIKLEKKEN